MNALVSQLQALAMQIECLRAQVDATLATALAQQPVATRPVDQDACPKCGASGEAQQDTSRLDGSRRMTCTVCHEERVLS